MTIVNPKTLDELTLDDFDAYEEVRQFGGLNMLMDARAASMEAELDIETYMGVHEHYTELREQRSKENGEPSE